MEGQQDKDPWLARASHAFSDSTTYFDTNIRAAIEEDIKRFQGRHPSGSKYYTDSYRSRSRLFRPVTRSGIRTDEATAAAAFFSTQEVVNVQPNDDNDQLQMISADLNQQLLQYRLTKSIPWFMICIGAYQDALNVGVVCSYQNWEYDENKGKDQPMIDLIPVENIRISPSAKWYDPINTSPYVIHLIPMYVKDVEAMMDKVDPKTGEPKWKKLTRDQIGSATRHINDSVRQTREEKRTDSTEGDQSIHEFTIVWIHRNIMEFDGVDKIYYTLGTEFMLSDPKPLKEVYHHGNRPYVMGCTVIETHRTYPSSPNRLGKDLQKEINEIANTRIDNIRFALSKRYFAARDRQVDIRSLIRNVTGSVTLMKDPDKDVKVQETKDVTSSSYQEQDRLKVEYDELMGHFSGSSVQSNRNLNETVGGMEMLSNDANKVSEYQLHVFVETWVKPVLRQIMKLEQTYESDETILALAGVKAGLPEKYGVHDITDEMLQQELLLSINVGIGATNPQIQAERFIYGMKSIREMLGDDVIMKLNPEEIITELFGKLGYKDGSRFFNFGDEENPQLAQYLSIIEQLQQQLALKESPEITAAKVEEILAKVDKIRAETVKIGVEAQYAAMQGGEVVASIPEVTPIGDQILRNANPSVTEDEALQAPDRPISQLALEHRQNTTPYLPPVPQEADQGAYQGIETQESD